MVKPNSDTVPAGVCSSCEVVLLGTGSTFTTTWGVLLPPKVARKLWAKRSTSAGATYTWLVSYCGATATLGVAAKALPIIALASSVNATDTLIALLPMPTLQHFYGIESREVRGRDAMEIVQTCSVERFSVYAGPLTSTVRSHR